MSNPDLPGLQRVRSGHALTRITHSGRPGDTGSSTTVK